MGQITATRNLVATKVVRHAGQLPRYVNVDLHLVHPYRRQRAVARCSPPETRPEVES